VDMLVDASVSEKRGASIFRAEVMKRFTLGLKMETARFSEKLAPTNISKLRHDPKQHHEILYCCFSYYASVLSVVSCGQIVLSSLQRAECADVLLMVLSLYIIFISLTCKHI
jgi:hypothetical protein